MILAGFQEKLWRVHEARMKEPYTAEKPIIYITGYEVRSGAGQLLPAPG